MNVVDLINMMKVLAVDNLDMKAPEFVKIVEKEIQAYFQRLEEAEEKSKE